MTQIDVPRLTSVADYLAAEEQATAKHEFVGGMVYPLSGGTITHDTIVGNCFAYLHSSLRGKPCRPFSSDMKIRVQLATQTRFYYPDASVVCDSNDPTDSFQDRPVFLAEVASPSTKRIDEGEKKEAYLSISTLQHYLLIDADQPVVCAFHRDDQGFVREVYTGPSARIPLADIGIELPLSELYDGVTF